jgi:hypothetical protein
MTRLRASLRRQTLQLARKTVTRYYIDEHNNDNPVNLARECVRRMAEWWSGRMGAAQRTAMEVQWKARVGNKGRRILIDNPYYSGVSGPFNV